MEGPMSATMTAASHAANPLIAGARVAGTDVYNTAGEHLGSIYDVMLDKATGKVAYAIMSFGGFLGLGEKYHPIPWSARSSRRRPCTVPTASPIGTTRSMASACTIITAPCPTG